jgi:hypothetical protein
MNEKTKLDDNLTQLEDHAVWHVNAALSNDRHDLADEISQTFTEAVLALLTEVAC